MVRASVRRFWGGVERPLLALAVLSLLDEFFGWTLPEWAGSGIRAAFALDLVVSLWISRSPMRSLFSFWTALNLFSLLFPMARSLRLIRSARILRALRPVLSGIQISGVLRSSVAILREGTTGLGTLAIR